MPRIYVKKKVPAYSDEELKQAITAVENGTSIFNASKKFKIPYETLRRWVIKMPTHKGSGKLPVFSYEEEHMIVECLKFMARCGYPQDRKDLKYIVKNFAEALPPSRKMKLPFKDFVPGPDWLRNFEKRWHEELRKRKPEILTKSRANAMTPYIVNHFFDMYEELLNENNLLECPERIFNLDETGLGTDARNCGVFVAKNARTAYQRSATCGKTMFSVLFCVSADGKYMPPFTIYKSKHIYDAWTHGGPSGAMYGCTDSGWMTDSVFEQWIKHFSKHVADLPKPILLIFDGHGSHLTYETIKHAIENQIIVLCLPPNSSHALQPLDVGVFAPLKKQWKDILKAWFTESRYLSVTKSVFPMLLGKLFKNMSAKNIIKGFKGSGIFPPNRKAIAHKITISSEHAEGLQPAVSVSSNMPSSSQITSLSQSQECMSQSTISSPFKDLKCAILSAISPKPSDFTSACMNNLKRKRKRVQASTGEVLTNEDVLERLKMESEKRNELKDKKMKLMKKKKSSHSVEIIGKETAKCMSTKQCVTVGAWVKALYLGKKSSREFIGKIMAVEGNTYEVKYLKKSEIGNFFIFPDVDDMDIIEEHQVIKILNEPQFNNRGHYFFEE